MVPECYLRRYLGLSISISSTIPTPTENYVQPGSEIHPDLHASSITNIYKVGDTQPIPSPNDAQLEALTVLTERAHRRSRERKKAEEEVNRILNTKESMMAANQFDYVTQHQLHQMERQLKGLNSVLIEIQDEEAFDAIEEERIWSQIELSISTSSTTCIPTTINNHNHQAHSHDLRQNNELTTDMVTVHTNHHNRFFRLPLLSFTTRRRARDRELIQQEVARKEATTVTSLYYHWLYPDRLEGMEQEEGKSQQPSQSTGTVQNEPRTASQAQKRPHDQSVSSESGNKPRTTYYLLLSIGKGTSAGILETSG
ncbi:hypothetical protein N7530_009324 [Penicillium desertorum]|uniref:Uncharacterized protein n=1 Tax=Penicillium desertorum TaxID=1303715 RepID=A0A9X0BI57_9EURO|nr:hypothetical protein N7530_009324 [Penicillium desertorum]